MASTAAALGRGAHTSMGSKGCKQAEVTETMISDTKMKMKPSVIQYFRLGDLKWLCKSQFLPRSASVVSEASFQSLISSLSWLFGLPVSGKYHFLYTVTATLQIAMSPCWGKNNTSIHGFWAARKCIHAIHLTLQEFNSLTCHTAQIPPLPIHNNDMSSFSGLPMKAVIAVPCLPSHSTKWSH